MILVFIILSLIILVLMLIFILVLSTIKLEISKLHIYNTNEKQKLKFDFKFNISISFFNKIKIIKFTIDNIKIKNLLNSKKINIQKLKENQNINKDTLKILKNIDIKIEYFYIEGCFATFNPVLTSNIFAILHSIIPILISRKIQGKYINKLEFLNINKNIINLNFNCIINIKLVNIISILYYLIKKGGKNNGESSNRRAYAYSNE